MERKATITITTSNGTTKGFVLVRDDGTLADQIQDCDADLGDIYSEIELAISGESLGKRAVEGEGEGYSFVVEPLPPTVRFTISAPELDPNDGTAYNLQAVANDYARCLRDRIEQTWPGAGELATIKIERHQIGGASRGGEFLDGTPVDENILRDIQDAAFDSIEWAACEVDDIESILDELRAARDEDRDADVDEDAAFRAVYGRDPDADDRKDDIWSLIYAGLDA